MRKTLLLSLFVSLSFCLKAQDFSYGTFFQEEMAMKKYDKDTAAHAVYLNEYGSARIDAVSDDNIKMIYTYHAKIKIFDNAGFDQGNIEVPLYNSKDGESAEEINGIKGVTTYTDENGSIKTVDLDNSKIFKVKDGNRLTIAKFTMPALHKDCIIEYTYTIYSPFAQGLHTWDLQASIPKIYSEFEVHIPGFWNYNAALTGPYKLTKNSAEIERDCFSWYGAHADCSHIIYGMKDIPAFIEEADMTAKKNFAASISFEMIDFTSPSDGVKHIMTREWKDVDAELKHDDDFGGQLKKKDFFKDKIASVTSGKTDSLEKAKAVYEYIKKNIKWNEYYGYYTDNGLKKAFESHTGNSADINLSLTAALNAAGFDAEAVLLSTRNNGIIKKLYPVMTDFNYVVSKVDIGGKTYLLDATDPLLTFGMLPERCLNDQGRVMCLDKPSYWIDMQNKQKRSSTYNFDLTLQPDGKITGTMIHYSTGYEAYEKRQAIKKFNSVDEYIESLDEASPRFKIKKSEISNLDSLDLPLGEKYDIEIKAYNGLDHNRLSFNPFIWDYIDTNPYRLNERNYPVDRGMPSIDRYTLTLHLPDNYIVETPPQTVNVGLPNNGGQFTTYYQSDNNSFTFSHIIQFNKSIYSSQEYPYLKELFNQIILSQKAEMVIKQKI